MTGKNLDSLDKQLYGSQNQNALHSLTARLKKSLLDFIANSNYGHTGQQSETHQLYSTAGFLLERDLIHEGFKILKKAEKAAVADNQRQLLNDIYLIMIRNAHRQPQLNLENIISKQQANAAVIAQEARIAISFARAQEKLLENETNLIALFEEELASADISIDARLSLDAIFQIMRLAVSAATLDQNYSHIAYFIEKLYTIANEVAPDTSYQFARISYLIAGTRLRNRQFEDALKILDKLLERVRRHHPLKSEALLLKALCQHFTKDIPGAIDTLHKISSKDPDIQMARALCHIHAGNPREAYRELSLLKHTDAYYVRRQGWLWAAQRSFLEIVILVERNLLDLAENRLHGFEKRFRESIKNNQDERMFTFIALTKEFLEYGPTLDKISFTKTLEKRLGDTAKPGEDLFNVCFYGWLKSKASPRTAYGLTLELLTVPEV